MAPQLLTRRRYSTLNPNFAVENRCGCGDGGARMNGAQIYELLVKYQITKPLSFMGNISIIRSAAKRADLDDGSNGGVAGDGIADTTFNSAKDFGTEIDLSLRYNVYKGFFTRLTFAYMFAGDYGKATGTGLRDFDDTWGLFSEMRFTF